MELPRRKEDESDCPGRGDINVTRSEQVFSLLSAAANCGAVKVNRLGKPALKNKPATEGFCTGFSVLLGLTIRKKYR